MYNNFFHHANVTRSRALKFISEYLHRHLNFPSRPIVHELFAHFCHPQGCISWWTTRCGSGPWSLSVWVKPQSSCPIPHPAFIFSSCIVCIQEKKFNFFVWAFWKSLLQNSFFSYFEFQHIGFSIMNDFDEKFQLRNKSRRIVPRLADCFSLLSRPDNKLLGPGWLFICAIFHHIWGGIRALCFESFLCGGGSFSFRRAFPYRLTDFRFHSSTNSTISGFVVIIVVFIPTASYTTILVKKIDITIIAHNYSYINIVFMHSYIIMQWPHKLFAQKTLSGNLPASHNVPGDRSFPPVQFYSTETLLHFILIFFPKVHSLILPKIWPKIITFECSR